MKKLLAILLCLSLIFALAACSKPESQTQQPAQAENQPVQPEQSGQPSEPEASAYPIEQFTVGTTAAIETATFGEYNFDMLAIVIRVNSTWTISYNKPVTYNRYVNSFYYF